MGSERRAVPLGRQRWHEARRGPEARVGGCSSRSGLTRRVGGRCRHVLDEISIGHCGHLWLWREKVGARLEIPGDLAERTSKTATDAVAHHSVAAALRHRKGRLNWDFRRFDYHVGHPDPGAPCTPIGATEALERGSPGDRSDRPCDHQIRRSACDDP